MRILMLTHRLPFPPNKGERLRAYHMIREMARWAEVDLVSFVDNAEEAACASHLADCVQHRMTIERPHLRNLMRGAAALATTTPLTHVLLDAPGARHAIGRLVAERRPDVVFAFCSGMARFAVEPPLRGLPLVVDMVDVDSKKWAGFARASRPPLSWIYRREALYLARFEASLAGAASSILVVNAREKAAMLDLAPHAPVIVVPIGVNVEAWRPVERPAPSARVVFCGVMDYAPNADAAAWLVREVWPRVRASRPDASLQLVGSNPTSAVRALADQARGITVTGTVPDVRPYVWGSAVAVAPLLLARGVQTKALEAVAGGIPCVVTPAVAEGLPAEILPACPVAASPDAFADAILRVLALDPAARRRMAGTADVPGLDWPHRLAPLRAIFEDAAGSAQTRMVAA